MSYKKIRLFSSLWGCLPRETRGLLFQLGGHCHSIWNTQNKNILLSVVKMNLPLGKIFLNILFQSILFKTLQPSLSPFAHSLPSNSWFAKKNEEIISLKKIQKKHQKRKFKTKWKKTNQVLGLTSPEWTTPSWSHPQLS